MDLTFPLRSCFLALPLEDNAKKEFRRLQDLLQPWRDILSLQSSDTPHLTLQFWPSVMEIEYKQILEQAKRIAASHHPFSLRIEGTETFGKQGNDSVLFFSVPFSEELARLKKSCPWPSGQPFHPHITIARIRHPQKFVLHKKDMLKQLKDAFITMNVGVLRMYAEIDGKKQTPLGDFVLGKS